MSGSSVDGLDIAYVVIEEIGGVWQAQIQAATCVEFPETWKSTLTHCFTLPAKELLLAHVAFGQWMGHAINEFMQQYNLSFKIQFIASHGHTVFHEPSKKMSFQLGDGAHIAAITSLPVISDLRNMDLAFDGQGAPIVPIAEQLFWPEINYFLNIGGICNLTYKNNNEQYLAGDICAANRILNLLAAQEKLSYDKDGLLAASGSMHEELFYALQSLTYYTHPFPKSLSNEFGLNTVYPLIQTFNISVADKLHTYCWHIAHQISQVVDIQSTPQQLMITGGGAKNLFLIECISSILASKNMQVYIPDTKVVDYKEAMAMALIGVLRWREESNTLSTATGASRASVGGALWMN